MRTLVLNAGYEPLNTVSWQRAVCLVLLYKAEVVEESDKMIRSLKRSIALPKIIRLHAYISPYQIMGKAKCNRKNVLIRDKNICQYCGVTLSAKTATVDHIIPKSKGGKSSFMNLVACCTKCKNKKADRELKKSGLRLLSKPYKPDSSELLLLTVKKVS